VKVLHIIDSGGYYGAEVMLVELCLQQRQSGIDAHVLSIGDLGLYEKPVELQLRKRGIPVHLWRMRSLPNLVSARSMEKWAIEEGFDLLHSHGYKGNILFGLLPKKIRRLPVIATLHGWTGSNGLTKLRLYEWIDSIVLRGFSAVVLVNPLMQSQKKIRAIPNSILRVVPNGLGSSISRPDPKKIELIRNFRRHGPLVGAIGRLSKEKGFDLLIQAAACLKREGTGVRLLIIGEGPERARLESLIQIEGLNQDVLLIGYLSEANAYIPCFDVLVNSSYSEGLPITILEAMRASCPIIASDLPSLRYLLRDGDLGLLSKVGDSISFAHAIRNVITESASARKRAHVAKQIFNDHYNIKVMERAYRNVYESVLCKG